MHYDVVIIGAGMSGLAAGIRLAYFQKRVLILEKHYAFGGLNSYYTLDGRAFDVGLHALTNYVAQKPRQAPLNKLLRQLRIPREELHLCEQRHSEIRFPGRCLKFSNDADVLTHEVAREFPAQIDGFRKLVKAIREFDDTQIDLPYVSTRHVLASYLSDPVLVEMLLCPTMYYGSAEEHDLEFTSFVTLFKSILLEGFARPMGGVRTIIKALVRKFRAHGGKLAMQRAVESIDTQDGRVTSVTLADGEVVSADVVISSIGARETLRLCPDTFTERELGDAGRLSFVETIMSLDTTPAALGHDATIVFFCDNDRFDYSVPDGLIDTRSGVLCCPGNYQDHEPDVAGTFRLTWLANYPQWSSLDDEAYRSAKEAYRADVLDRMREYLPDGPSHVIHTDMFTPRTIERYTGRIHGAVYGVPHKLRDGRTQLKNLFLCGTDQGFLGIIGAMMSGVMMANQHVLSQE